jgi:hypothetical protein
MRLVKLAHGPAGWGLVTADEAFNRPERLIRGCLRPTKNQHLVTIVVRGAIYKRNSCLCYESLRRNAGWRGPQ